MSAISALAHAPYFRRGLDEQDEVDGVHAYDGALVALPEGLKSRGCEWYGMGEGPVEQGGAAAEYLDRFKIWPTGRRHLVGEVGVSTGFACPREFWLQCRANPKSVHFSAAGGVQRA